MPFPLLSPLMGDFLRCPIRTCLALNILVGEVMEWES